MLVGLLQPSEGSVSVGPFTVVDHPREASSLVGYVPDQPFLYDKLSGREFLEFVASMYGMSAVESTEAVERETERFPIRRVSRSAHRELFSRDASADRLCGSADPPA